MLIEVPHIETIRHHIEEQYEARPTNCGASFGELLCHELHHGGPHGDGLHFKALAAKWGVSLPVLGMLIADHCNRLEPGPKVNHDYLP